MPGKRARARTSLSIVRTPTFHGRTVNSDSGVIHERVFSDLMRVTERATMVTVLRETVVRDRERGMKNEDAHPVGVHQRMRPAALVTSDSWMIENTQKTEPIALSLNSHRRCSIDSNSSLRRPTICFQPFGSGRRSTLPDSDLGPSSYLEPRARAQH